MPKSSVKSITPAGAIGIGKQALLRAGIAPGASHLENNLAWQINAVGLPNPEREYRFDETRRWRLDFAWPDRRIAVEVEGGLWRYGRHQRPDGFRKDLQKYNSLSLRRWILIRVTADQIRSGEAVTWIETAFAIAGVYANPVAG